MSKCLYTEADVTQSGAQLLICSISLDGKTSRQYEKHFKRAFPESWNVADSMLKCDVDNENTDVNVGDVIWTRTGGNKHIGFCVVNKEFEDEINKDAVKLCINSAKLKARELNINYVGMDLFASKSPQEWASIVGILESSLEEIQGIVCIPDNDALTAVMENLPGSNNFTVVYGK